jgi:hypothetical protein
METNTLASAWKLTSKLDGYAERIMNALVPFGQIPDDGTNPVWLALAGLNPMQDDDLEALIEAGEMSPVEADMMRATSAKSRDYADLLRPHVWKGRSPAKNDIMRAYVLCQTSALNCIGGPIGDESHASIRQRWYTSKSAEAMGFKFAAQALERYLIQSADIVLVDDVRAHERALSLGAKVVEYKTQFKKTDATRLKLELGREPRVHTWPKAGWGRTYAQLHSQIMVELVKNQPGNPGLTYRELWIEDVSRKVSTTYSRWGLKAVLCLEKEGLHPLFEGFCRSAGIPVLIAMAGNSSFASVESVLNENFRHYNGGYTPTTHDPLHLIVLSDHDYPGHVPVMQGVVTQFERYLPHALELHRLGISPEQVAEAGRSPVQAGYEFEATFNSAYAEWAYAEGCWTGRDDSIEVPYDWDKERDDYVAWAEAQLAAGAVCYGIECEALAPQAYVRDLAYLVVKLIGGDEEFLTKLIQDALPDWWQVTDQVGSALATMIWVVVALEELEQFAANRLRGFRDSINHWIGERRGDPKDEEAWAARADVQQEIATAVAKEAGGVTPDTFAEHILSKGGAYQPMTSAAATQVARQLFVKHHLRDKRMVDCGELDNAFSIPDLLCTITAASEDLRQFLGDVEEAACVHGIETDYGITLLSEVETNGLHWLEQWATDEE